MALVALCALVALFALFALCALVALFAAKSRYLGVWRSHILPRAAVLLVLMSRLFRVARVNFVSLCVYFVSIPCSARATCVNLVSFSAQYRVNSVLVMRLVPVTRVYLVSSCVNFVSSSC